ncbi:diaminopimelate decarboxylase [Aquisalinus flavus]|uniref:Diaminopimelate decarboxylase n=1 Tax=Aquisalinus flavus TaxID=1526572 RepID=A0A8J2Y632_9PROT|nr:diaminopimelate decarboxylase [Aquisalinus flavus]MBD0427008.1 diaminopimelate decarboxylase [Aquisalinus flavus]UNE46838.1 diaminopimelate decarboxylase [Aquisalinus flavus]GGC97645.1 diaminopimelate decarboxylase [Aquisalinus flavus]
MHHFEYRDGVLHAEDIPLDRLAGEIGTPFYCYSAATLRRHYSVFADAFKGQDTLVAFSVKSLSNVAVLSLLAKLGAGADVVSGGELFRALRAGIPGEKIVFSGVGKTRAEMADALKAGICQFNVESEAELIALDEVARSMNVRAPVALRVNPDVAAGSHDKISTGRKTDKFGISWSIAADVYARAATMEGIDVSGVDVHIGSQITDLAPFGSAFSKVAALVSTLRDQGHDIRRLDLGGGLGVPYHHQDATPPPPHPLDYAKVIHETASHLDLQLIFEPGRMIAGNAGILVARVTYLKENEGRHFAILDCGMNDLIRPALYDAWHDIIPVTEPAEGVGTSLIDIVGPVCESTDRFARNRDMPPLKPGDLVAFLTAGAYGAVQGNEYNTRPLAPELLVDGDRHAIIRRRPTYDEMIAREDVPDWV